MNLRTLSIVSLTSTFVLSGFAAPKRKKRRLGERGHQPISIQSVKFGGKGCQQGATASIVTATDPANPEIKDFFELIYDAFYVEATADSEEKITRSGCTVTLNLDLPDNMKLRMTKIKTEMNGFADLHPKTKGIVRVYTAFNRNKEEAEVKRFDIDSESNDGDFSINNTSVIRSSADRCGKARLKIRTALAIRTKPRKTLEGNENSFIQIDETTGLLTQNWRVKLVPCERDGDRPRRPGRPGRPRR